MSEAIPSLRRALGVLALFAAPSLAQDCWAPDAFDHSGADPAPISVGTHTGLSLRQDVSQPAAAHDSYTLDLPPQSRLTLQVIATSPYSAPLPNSFVYTSQPVPPTTFEGVFQVAGMSVQQAWRTNADGTPTPPDFGRHLEPVFENATNAPLTVEFSVTATALSVFGCVEYSMDVAVTPRPCNTAPDDALEGPNDCTTATPLPTGLSTDLIVFDNTVTGGFDPDYYRITNVQPGEAVALTLLPHDAQPVPLGMRMTDDPICVPSAAVDLTAFAMNESGTTRDYYVYVETWEASFGAGSERTGCKRYDLHLMRIPSACGSLAADVLEPNAPCTQPVAISPGSYSGLTLDGSSDDYYTVNVPALHRLRTVVVGATPEARVGVTGAFLSACPQAGSGDRLEFANHEAHAQTYGLRISSYHGMCSAYDLEVIVEPVSCSPGYVPAIDPGSTCATAVDFPEGTRPFYDDPALRSSLALSNFSLAPGDEDFLRIVVRPHDTYVAYLSSNWEVLDFDAVPEGGCGTTPTPSKRFAQWSPSTRNLILPNDTGAHLTYIVRVFGTSQHTLCTPYGLGYYRGDPCAMSTNTPAVFDQTNTSCLNAPLVPAASVGYQALSQGSARFVRTLVPAGRTLTAGLTPDSLHALGSSVSLELHDGLADCSASGASLGSVTCTPTVSVNSIQFTNTGAQDREVLVETRLAAGVLDCGVVWLDLTLDDGSPYVTECLGLDATGLACPCGNQLPSKAGGGCANSADRSARLAATGSNSIAADDLLLHANELPAHRQGLLLVEPVDFQPLPLGRLYFDGKLCVDPADATGVLRLKSSSQGAWQTFTPLAGLLGATAGRTHRAQIWYRDANGPCGSGSNTTNAIRIEWQP